MLTDGAGARHQQRTVELDQCQWGKHVDLVHRGQLVQGVVLQVRQRARAKAAGVVDKQVQATVLLHRGKQGGAVCRVGHVSGQCAD